MKGFFECPFPVPVMCMAAVCQNYGTGGLGFPCNDILQGFGGFVILICSRFLVGSIRVRFCSMVRTYHDV